MSKILKKGDSVMWRNRYGKEEPIQAEVIGITLKDKEQESVDWDYIAKNPREVFVTLDNGHWAYGYQVTALTENTVFK